MTITVTGSYCLFKTVLYVFVVYLNGIKDYQKRLSLHKHASHELDSTYTKITTSLSRIISILACSKHSQKKQGSYACAYYIVRLHKRLQV